MLLIMTIMMMTVYLIAITSHFLISAEFAVFILLEIFIGIDKFQNFENSAMYYSMAFSNWNNEVCLSE